MSLEMLNKKDPEVLKSLYEYRRKVFKSGSLTPREKELIAFSLAAYIKCEKCLEYHADRAKKEGATGQDILEALEVVSYMTGPSGMIWSDKIDELVK
jgi:AhpD family alkylhydroperoxidase